MLKFLTTSGNSYHIEQIIIKSKTHLTIVTPYLKLSKNIISRFKDAEKREVQITLIYGKDELRKEVMAVLKELKYLKLYFCKNLHAKCYYNEKEMIISSMNLYEFSEKNNREMGVLLNNDSELFNEAVEEVNSIINSSELKFGQKGKNNSHIGDQNNMLGKIQEPDISDKDKISFFQRALVLELNSRFPELKFKCNDNSSYILCENFIVDKFELTFEPSVGFYRIVLRFKQKYPINRDLFEFIHKGKRFIIEKEFPKGLVKWGTQMRRIKLDFNNTSFNSFFTWDKRMINQIINILEISKKSIVKEIQEFDLSNHNSN